MIASSQSGFLPRRLLALVALVVLAAGCAGEKRTNVTGTVSIDGQVVTEGVVQFLCPGDRLATARIQPDGTFVATDVVPGEEVRIAILEDPDRGMFKMTGGSDGSAPPVVEPTPLPKAARIPEQYKSFETSGLTYTISADSPRVDITLKR